MHPDMILGGTLLSEEFECELGDRRRTKRLQQVADAMARGPALSFPQMMDPAELEGAYRLLRNSSLSFRGVLAAHMERTSQRVAALGEALVVHDTTTFSMTRRDGHLREHLNPHGSQSQGFFAHVSLAVSADGLRAPLGVLGCHPFIHDSQASEETRAFWDAQFPAFDSEGERWLAAVQASRESVPAEVSLIHVCDREADRGDMLEWHATNNQRFIIRSCRNWESSDGLRVRTALQDQPFAVERTIELSPRSLQGVPKRSKTFPERRARTARVGVRAGAFTFTVKKTQHTVACNMVEVLELAPPEGEEPVHWLLLTSEPVTEAPEMLRVVDLYRSRWLVEEFFKAIKTGCSFEKRQLDSAQTLLVALALTLPVAWHLLALRYLSRHHGDIPAKAIFNDLQMFVLRDQTRNIKWSKEPTMEQACQAVAYLGGHHRSNGPPGWQVLGRGLEKLLMIELGARIGAAYRDVIEP